MASYLIVGSSSGIGKELATLLLQQGHTVYGLNRRPVMDGSVSLVADVTTGPLPLISEPLDGIAYCPGSITLKPFSGIKEEDIRKDFEINAMGALRVLQHYRSGLLKSANASVVLFSTVAVSVGMPYHVSVAMAKGAVEGLTRSLAAEWAPKVRVNCIAPSLTDTPLAARLLDTDAKRASAAERHPLKQVGNPQDIAAFAAMLLQPTAAFITGQVLHMDGGMSSVKL